jgi:ubiquinone/menaquinone biosynthesis C-methylase UbiE
VENEREKMERVYRERQSLMPRYALDNPGNKFNYEHLQSAIARRLTCLFPALDTIRCLDLGSGILFWPEELIRIGVRRERCLGSDLLLSRLKEGHAAGRNVLATACSAAELPFPDCSMDLITQFTMMTSVTSQSLRKAIAAEMLRVLAPGGYILWYDFRYNNPSNKYTLAIGKSEIKALFDCLHVDFESITLLPPLARKLKGPLSPLLKYLDYFPILRSHYLVMIGPKG